MTGSMEGQDHDGRREALGVKVSRSEQMLFGDFARIVRHAGNAAESSQSATMVVAEYLDEARKFMPGIAPELDDRAAAIHAKQDELVGEAWEIVTKAMEVAASAQARLAELGMEHVRLSSEWLEETNRDAEEKRAAATADAYRAERGERVGSPAS